MSTKKEGEKTKEELEQEEKDKLAQTKAELDKIIRGPPLSEFVIRFPGPEQTFSCPICSRKGPVSFETIVGPKGASIILPEPEPEPGSGSEPEPPQPSTVIQVLQECACDEPEPAATTPPVQYVVKKVHTRRRTPSPPPTLTTKLHIVKASPPTPSSRSGGRQLCMCGRPLLYQHICPKMW